MHNNYAGWEEVPEEMISEAIEVAEHTQANDKINFQKILAAGDIFKKAGLTPVYVWCDKTHRLAVFAEELNANPRLVN